MRISDDRYDRDLRKYNLAMWMLEHAARTRTITQWTGLTRYRVQLLFRTYHGQNPPRRLRGTSPTQPSYFSKSVLLECESVALAYIALQMKTIPEEVVPDARRSLPGLVRGERLLTAFEIYEALVPDSHISLEHAVLLMVELAQRRALALRPCERCQGLMMIDRLGVPQRLCPCCRTDRLRLKRSSVRQGL